jgi:hypothetical protein
MWTEVADGTNMTENSDGDGNAWVRVTTNPSQGNAQGTLSHVVTGHDLWESGHNTSATVGKPQRAAVTAVL